MITFSLTKSFKTIMKAIKKATDGIRTRDLRLTKATLYQLSYSSKNIPKKITPQVGLEPTTS